MATTSRFMVHFTADGDNIVINAGATAPESISIANMPSHARRHCFETGLELLARNAVAGAAKAGWTDVQCHGYMTRKVRSIVAGQLKLSESNADFMHLVTAAMRVKGWPADRRGEMEAKLLAQTAEWRKGVERQYAKEIAQARLEYVTAQTANAAPSNLLEDF